METDELPRLLEPFGVTVGSLVRLDGPLGPEHVGHLDLHPKGTPSRLPAPVDAIVEMGGRAILYVKRGPVANQDSLIPPLAQRGAADYIAFVEPGQLTVLPLSPKQKGKGETGERRVSATAAEARGFVPSLALGTRAPFGNRTARALANGLFDLLQGSTENLTSCGVEPDDALALVGRALFFRFLMDRNIVVARDRVRIAKSAEDLEGVMASAEGLLSTSVWLDRTFNGHLLPVDLASVFSKPGHGEVVCEQLTRILTRTSAGGQLSFEWAKLDFGHIPVGLLSEIYESWSHDYRHAQAKRESVWYTPTFLATFMVSEALGSLEDTQTAVVLERPSLPHSKGASPPEWTPRVLDPSVGGGVFLVAAFRSLVAALWKRTEQRPSREQVRDILYGQLTGLDVNDAALRLSALALYLTALELDPNPGPGSHVRFEDLCKIGVLRNVGATSLSTVDAETRVPPVGSLGEKCCQDLYGKFDLVIGNPPWTGWEPPGRNKKEKEKNRKQIELQRKEVERTVTKFIRERLGESEPAFEMIQNEPDLPMLWCAARWAQPGGVIALAMHAHFLFRQTPEAVRARDTVFRGLTVTGVLNGSGLRETRVWPHQKAPFAFVFARNWAPGLQSGLRYLSPTLDRSLNTEGYLRLDASARHPVLAVEVREQPWLLKTLFRGGPMDASVMERILGSSGTLSLGEWWPEDFSSLGFIRGRDSQQRACEELRGREELFDSETSGVEVSVASRRPFRDTTLTEPRTGAWKRAHPDELKQGFCPRVFRGPLVVVRSVPRAETGLAPAMLSNTDLLYNNSFLGFSAAWHPEGPRVGRYLALVLNSRVALYALLLSASGFGVERPKLLLNELCSLHMPRWDDLDEATKSEADEVWESLRALTSFDSSSADAFVGKLFNLSRSDLECIKDTLDIGLPFEKSALRAQARPNEGEQEHFRERLEAILAPLLKRSERKVRVRLVPSEKTDPWCTLWISTVGSGQSRPDVSVLPEGVKALAKEALALALGESASRVVLERKDGLFLGIFAQYRYWTPTQARALAMDILDEPRWMQVLRGGG